MRERLWNILKQNEIPHAFLFSGPRGAGKTSAARIIAKIVNCEKREKDGVYKEPCNKCAACQAITQGRHLDVVEIDAASNRGIDEIRALRDNVAFTASSARMKVFIIDEVHMLTKPAFNALLKTLEEPPEHVMFILATTEAEKLLETVRSRCVEISFPKADSGEIARSLKRVAKGENLQIDEKTLKFIAQNTDGSFRDAVKILEEAASSGKDIQLKEVEKAAGIGVKTTSRFIDLLAEKKAQEILVFLDKQIKEGLDPRWLTESVLQSLHEMFLKECGAGESVWSKSKFKKENLIRLLRLLEKAGREQKNAVMAQIPLELALIKYCAEEVKKE